MQIHFSNERQDIRGLTCWGICQLVKCGEHGMTIVHIPVEGLSEGWFQNCKCETSLGRCCARCCISSRRALMCAVCSRPALNLFLS